jgi:hypothetical protein
MKKERVFVNSKNGAKKSSRETEKSKIACREASLPAEELLWPKGLRLVKFFDRWVCHRKDLLIGPVLVKFSRVGRHMKGHGHC